MAATRTWVSILIAAVAIVIVLCLALVGGSIYWFRQHIDTQSSSRQSAAVEFTRERARFAGQQPLLELRAGDTPVIHRAPNTLVAEHAEITDLHVLAYDVHEGKIIRAHFPMWLMRLAPRSQFGFLSDSGMFSERVHLTVDDIERRGPGLVLDVIDKPIEGGRLLVWTD
jgi:hypothetical protein